MLLVRTTASSVLALALVFCLGGCDTLTKQQMGVGLGAAVGGLAGNQVGKGQGRVLATMLGMAGGGLLGSWAGSRLDEQDRQQAAAAAQQALDTGSTQRWQSRNTGAAGTVQVVNTAPPVQTAGRQCRTLRQQIKLKDGSSRSEDVTACKGPNGWETV